MRGVQLVLIWFSMENISTYPISKAREELSNLFNKVIFGQIIKVTRRGIDNSALLVPDVYQTITDKKAGYHEKLPILIADFLLPNAHANIVKAQIADLRKLNLNQLMALMEINSLPLERMKLLQMSKIVGEEFIDRLEKRHRISVSIQEAEEHGLYEAAEHLSNKLPW